MPRENGTRAILTREFVELLDNSGDEAAVAERIRVSLISAKLLSKTAKTSWRREWESWSRLAKT